ncbi:PQQ-binding-like beta-propeller repeat protein [uncultured Chloroflexus sp.]|uniref:PQQ-binding-like beta-propeller repeat protein n=1 Tax=uncultured Chloroflexus sp. TaxID=214040 RepID=UPI0026148698|nr:PQQ-binding-like beta-propeller repeat protein [uncultured Chloroflexus sp.]
MGRILSLLIALAMLSSACGLGVTAPAALVTSSPTPTINVASTPTPIVVNIPIIFSPSRASGWNQLGGNPQRTGYVEATLPPRRGAMYQDWSIRWIWNGPNGDSGATPDHLSLPDGVAPVAGNGRLYVGHSDGIVRAINIANGQVVWSTTIGGIIRDTGAYDPLTDSVFFASTNGRIARLRATTGEILNQFDTGGSIEQAVLLVNDTVYIGNMIGRLYALHSQTLQQRWMYNAGAAISASAAYASKNGGLIIFPSEDGFVHAVRAVDGQRVWRVAVNAALRPYRAASATTPERPARRFPDVYPVVAEQADVVIVRSYFDWHLQWTIREGAPVDQNEIRRFLEQNPNHQSLFVLDLDDGARRFTAPVFGGGIGNGGYFYSSPPAVVVKRLPDGSDVAYLHWRNRSACSPPSCVRLDDTTFGEMNLTTGVIRYVQDHKDEGMIRLPTDEQSAITMVGNVLFHSHWMALAALRITDRTIGGDTFANPIPTTEYLLMTNTLAQGQCPKRNSVLRYCPEAHQAPEDTYLLDPGFYLYYHNRNVYDQFWHPPVRGPIFHDGVLYWRSVDGAIVALAPNQP